MSKRLTTDKRAEAARINGAKSRGPKTPEGKARVSQNAFKHGAYAQPGLLLANEDPSIFHSFRDGFYDKFQPSDDVELALVDEMIFAQWRMRRFWFAQDATIDIEINRQIPILEQECDWISEPARLAKAITSLIDDSNSLEFLYRVEARFRRQFSRALTDLIRLRAQRNPPASKNEGTNPSPTQPTPPQPITPAPEPKRAIPFAAALLALFLLCTQTLASPSPFASIPVHSRPNPSPLPPIRYHNQLHRMDVLIHDTGWIDSKFALAKLARCRKPGEHLLHQIHGEIGGHFHDVAGLGDLHAIEETEQFGTIVRSAEPSQAHQTAKGAINLLAGGLIGAFAFGA
jgi:hypothetical protein